MNRFFFGPLPFDDVSGYIEAATTLASWIREAGSTPVIYGTWAMKAEESVQEIMNNVNRKLTEDEVKSYRKMITRYFDVTRSQLLFSNGCLFIEGISECQLMETFSKLMEKSLIDNQIEIVDTDGTAFYQFLMLFNSSTTYI